MLQADEPTMPGVGLVETRSALLFTPDDPLHLAAGQRLDEVHIAYETYGTLNEARDNAIYICHALTGDAHAAGWHQGDRRPGWWDNLIGPGRAIDTDRWFVVASNLLGGCSGSTGPSSTNPATGEPYGLDFPLLDMADFVTVHRRLGEHLGVAHWHAVVGGSLGGMQVLEWQLTHPDDMRKAVIIASSSRLTAQNIAFSAVGRQAIMRDENFDVAGIGDGRTPDVGLAIARMMAHITYLSEDAFEEKFGRAHQHGAPRRGFGVDFAVESYLDHQGEAFLTRFDALSYLYLTRVMDYFDPFARPDATATLSAHPVENLVLSFDTDWRFSTAQSRRIVRQLEDARVPVTFREITSPWGHDSFLLQPPEYHEIVKAFIECEVAERPAAARCRAARGLTAGLDRPQDTASRMSEHPAAGVPLRPDLEAVASLIAPRSRVLDLGCGPGTLLRHLIDERGCSGTGVEIDPDMVLAAVGAGVPVIGLDIDRELPQLADQSFDVAILSRTLQTVHRPAEVLAQMARISRRLVVSMPNFGLWRHRLRLLRGHMPESRELPFSWHDTPNLHHATLVDLERFFAEQGLQIEHRLPLTESGRRLQVAGRGIDRTANLLAGNAVYVLRSAH